MPERAPEAHAEDALRRGAEVYAGSVLYTLAEMRRLDLHFGARVMDHRMFAIAATLRLIQPSLER